MQSKFMVIDDLGVEYLDKNGNFLQRLDESKSAMERELLIG